MSMGRGASLRFQIDLLKDNFSKTGAQKLGCDQVPGMVDYVERPDAVPRQAQWLGGIGEGAWFVLRPLGAYHYEVVKYHSNGQQLSVQQMQCSERFSIEDSYEFTYDLSYHHHVIKQQNQLFAFHVVQQNNYINQTDYSEKSTR